jgi:hypothetical protein
MTMERAYANAGEGFAVCCWNAPDQKALEELFKKAGVKFKKLFPVEEMTGSPA